MQPNSIPIVDEYYCLPESKYCMLNCGLYMQCDGLKVLETQLGKLNISIQESIVGIYTINKLSLVQDIILCTNASVLQLSAETFVFVWPIHLAGNCGVST